MTWVDLSSLGGQKPLPSIVHTETRDQPFTPQQACPERALLARARKDASEHENKLAALQQDMNSAANGIQTLLSCFPSSGDAGEFLLSGRKRAEFEFDIGKSSGVSAVASVSGDDLMVSLRMPMGSGFCPYASSTVYKQALAKDAKSTVKFCAKAGNEQGPCMNLDLKHLRGRRMEEFVKDPSLLKIGVSEEKGQAFEYGSPKSTTVVQSSVIQQKSRQMLKLGELADLFGK